MSRYSQYKIINNLSSELYTSISSSATSVQLNAWQWERRWNEFPIIATLENFDSNWKVAKREIVIITARTWDVLTIQRKAFQCFPTDDDNSLALKSRSFDAGDTISNYIAKEYFNKIKDWFDNVDSSFDDVYENWTDELRTYKTTWLWIEVKPWKVLVWSSYYDFVWWNLTLTDNATNYIEIDEDWILVSNTTSRTLENAKISKVITSWWEITSIQDRRLWTVWWKIWWIDIHELTGKIDLSWNDEFIIADSENIYQNKKAKYSNIIWIWWTPAGDIINKSDILLNEYVAKDNEIDWNTAVWFSNNVQKISRLFVWNWTQFNSLKLSLAKNGTPSNNLSIRIETDDNWNPSWTLIDDNAYWTISQASLSGTLTDMTVNLAWNITINKMTPCHLVLSQWIVDASNYYMIWWKNIIPKVFKIKQYDWSNWNNYQDYWWIVSLSKITSAQTKSLNNASRSVLSRDWQYLFIYWNYIQWYKLATPRDISWIPNSTNSFTTYRNVANGTWQMTISPNPDWWIYLTYITYSNPNWTIFVAKIPDPWNSNTMTDFSSKSFNDINVNKVLYNIDWTKMFIIPSNNAQDIKEYSLTTPYMVSTAVATWNTLSRWTVASWVLFWSWDFSDDWKLLILIDLWNWWNMRKYILTTPYDITTATLTDDTKSGIRNDWWISIWSIYNCFLVYYSSTYTKYNLPKDNTWSNTKIYSICDWLYDWLMWKATAKDVYWLPIVPMVSTWNFNLWEIVRYRTDVWDIMNGLTVWTKYYLSDTPWQISSTPWSEEFEVWIAIEPTVLKLKQDY